MTTLYAALGLLSLLCAGLSVRAARLLHSALWLAGCSASLAALLYALGAHEVAVIELSVGAGLVTVLFVFAIAVAGDEAAHATPVVPRPLAWAAIALLLAVIGATVLPLGAAQAETAGGSFADALWRQRSLDVAVQVVLMFASALGVLGLLGEPGVEAPKADPAPVAPPKAARP
jgi:NADH:ubiquinone oxidoreductase subunit 6 (subunit J)